MKKKRLDYSGWLLVPMIASMIIIFICFIIMIFLGKYGVKGLYAEFFNGILALSLGVMMLSLSLMFISGAIKDIRSGNVDYKAYFKGFLLALRSVAVIFLLIILVVFIIELAKSKQEKLIYTIAAFAIGIALFVLYVKHCKKHKSMQGNIWTILFVIIVFPLVTILGFYGGTKTIYNATSDIMTKNTEDVILTNVDVTKKSSSKGGTTYTLSGYDLNNKKTAFSITSGTYRALKGNSTTPIKIVYYEKSRVINNIYRLKYNYVD